MNLANSSSMEEIPLEDVDRTSIEYRVLMAYAQRRLSASKYGQLLEREAKGKEGSSLGKEEIKGKEEAYQDFSPEDQEQSTRDRSQKKKKKKSSWKCFQLCSCLRTQVEEEPGKTFERGDTVNGHALMSLEGVGSEPTLSSEAQDDSDISHVVDRLAEIIDNSKSYPERKELKALVRTVSLEEDGGWATKPVCEDDGLKDGEEKIIKKIVAILRKSGDELLEKVQKDKTCFQCVSELMSYAFFSRVANQFLEEIPIDCTLESELQVQGIKVAFAVEVITKLTAIDNHPMNILLGFGTKYLKENFSPWIHSQGGWKKALELPDQEEVE
ncbi:apoptosis facilitator Bcl-2-like protein 14 isoform X2 [Rhineura floridana]|nr:apoptosis facilitator Bcl-2-like protein 14 isoform X2 [Rhineura floridana]XP_061438475.1 apoptosis facilitator Bcl-2-like protein 14 isoform X2 [Rhineura floridana]XP_061438476.1 apoptosis facilitator Bcl-2-like protein 14 isoform X2 [Rhineura floridana]